MKLHKNIEDGEGEHNNFTKKKNLVSQLGKVEYSDEAVVSAEAFSITYFLQSNGEDEDPKKEAWEEETFLSAVQSKDVDQDLSLSYFATRSFSDEFGSAIQGDLAFVQVSYIIVFVFLGTTLGRFCGPGSR